MSNVIHTYYIRICAMKNGEKLNIHKSKKEKSTKQKERTGHEMLIGKIDQHCGDCDEVADYVHSIIQKQQEGSS